MKQPVRVYIEPDIADLEEIIQRPAQQLEKIGDQVANIIYAVQMRGDEAVLEFTRTFDGISLPSLVVEQEEIQQGCKLVPQELKQALNHAMKNISAFHTVQGKNEPTVETQPGVVCWRRNHPIERVGIYVPGGTAPLLSSVLMLAVPAKLAGCSDIALATPPGPDGTVHPAVLYAAYISGVTKIYKMGGAQAIAAFAYGTESVDSVDKIFGPGNRYVTLAKQMVSVEGVSIDLPAGPSEVMILAGRNADLTCVAADMLSQAEHGFDSQSILIVPDPIMANKVVEHLKTQLEQLPRKEYAVESLKHSRIVCTKDREKALELINAYAPEHLIFLRDDWETWEHKIRHAGSVFIGPWTPESAGDYASGTNHTLPTGGWARSCSGVSLESFQKHTTYQRLSKEGFLDLSSVIETLAEAEGLEAHRRAVEVRKQALSVNGHAGDNSPENT